MSKARATAFSAAVIIGLVFATAVAELAQAQGQPEDEKVVKSLVLERIQQFNRHEAPEPGAFTEDADFVNAYGMWRSSISSTKLVACGMQPANQSPHSKNSAFA